MNRNYFKWIVGLALLSLLVVAIFMWKERPSPKFDRESEGGIRHSLPFKSYISAVGIVEASSENIFIGSPVNRVVYKVEVKVGEKVKEGQVLFRLECRDLEADLLNRCIAYENALASLQKLEAMPRKEDVIAAEAALKSSQVQYDQMKSEYNRVNGLQTSGAMSHEEVAKRKYAFEEAEAKLVQIKADYDRTMAGAWQPDIRIAKLQAEQAKALVERTKGDLDRTIIRAPIDATVLQIKIHEGEYPPSDSSRTPPMIIGNIDTLNLRVSINQFDASFYNPEETAIATLQGNARLSFPLTFVRLEPFFVTKQNITNDITEKVDTRVLQVVYSFKEGEERIFVGQQMDVFIKADYPKNTNQIVEIE